MNESMNQVISFLFKAYLKVPRAFLMEFDATTTIYLSTLIEWNYHLLVKEKLENGGCFFMTQNLIQFQVGLSQEQQTLSIKKLKEANVLKVERRGIPPKNYYKINYEKIQEMIQNFINKQVSNNREPRSLDDREQRSMQAGKHGLYYNDIKNNKPKGNEGVPNGTPQGATSPLDKVAKPILLIRRKNPTPIEFYSSRPTNREDVLAIVTYWNNSPGLRHHQVPNNGYGQVTKTFVKIAKDIADVLDGKYIQSWPPYSKEAIIKAIDGFKTRFTNRDYAPANKAPLKHVDLTNFFWNPFSNAKSLFIECVENPPELLKNTVPKEPEKNPQLTKWLQKLYVDNVLLGQPKTFNQIEINKFIKGANMLQDSIQQLRKRANLVTGPYEFCEYTVNALCEHFSREHVRPGHIGSEWTYTELLPRYLKNVGRIE